MQEENDFENGQEYSLKASTMKIGQLYPVLKAADGEILDGNQRIKSDPTWKTQILKNIKTPEEKIITKLVANFHRRTVNPEEKTSWINELAEIYKNNGLETEGARNKAQGPNEIARNICQATGLSYRTVMEYLDPSFKQISRSNKAPEQHHTRSNPEDIIYSHLKYNPNWAREVIQRFKEEHEKELMESPLFRKKLMEKINGMPKCLNPVNYQAYQEASSNSQENREHLNQNDDSFLPKSEPESKYETGQEQRAKLEKETQRLSEPLPGLYETFIQQCPKCICPSCPHANECKLRLRPGD